MAAQYSGDPAGGLRVLSSERESQAEANLMNVGPKTLAERMIGLAPTCEVTNSIVVR